MNNVNASYFMANKLLIAHAFIALLLISACGGGKAKSESSPDSNNLNNSESTVEQLLANAVRQGIDGIFVYRQQGANAGFSYVAGIQNRELQTPADQNTLFKIASISKLFIAVSAVKIHHQQLLSLDDHLSLWLPELSSRIENAHQITIRMMLQHRSGIPDFDSQSGFSWQNAHSNIDDTLAFALDKPADFLPNARYEYSNTNYLLVGKILDKALGYNHGVFINEHILTPLTLTETYVDASEVDISLLAKGYWQNIERSNQTYAIPGGSMISTLANVGSFIRALNTGSLLTAAERQTYTQVYGFDHSGWLPGYQSIARYFSDKDLVLIQFINTTGDSSEEIAADTFDALYRRF